MAYTQEEIDYLKWLQEQQSRELATGSGVDAPAYSLSPGTYTPSTTTFNADGSFTITGGEYNDDKGLLYMENYDTAGLGDTQEHRDLMTEWLKTNSTLGTSSPSYVGDAQDYGPQDIEYLKWLDSQSGQEAPAPAPSSEPDPLLAELNLGTESLDGIKNSNMSNADKMTAINGWWDSVYAAERNNPEVFEQWVSENPNYAVRYFVRAANENVNQTTGVTNKEYQQRADEIGYQLALENGYGSDGKMDGRSYATSYDNYDDISNEWGPGDFFKIGEPAKITDGVMSFVENNPLKVAAIVGSMFIPAMAPALIQAAAAVGITMSPTVAAGVISAGLQAAQGGDFQDIVTSGISTYGLGELTNALPEIVSAIDPKTGLALTAISEGGENVEEAWNLVNPGGTFSVVGDLNDAIADFENTYEPPKIDPIDNPLLTPGPIEPTDTPGTLPELPGLPNDPSSQTPQYSAEDRAYLEWYKAQQDAATAAAAEGGEGGGTENPEDGVGTPWEYLGNDQWRNNEDNRVITVPSGTVGTGNTQVGDVQDMPEYDTSGETAEGGGLVLGGTTPDEGNIWYTDVSGILKQGPKTPNIVFKDGAGYVELPAPAPETAPTPDDEGGGGLLGPPVVLPPGDTTGTPDGTGSTPGTGDTPGPGGDGEGGEPEDPQDDPDREKLVLPVPVPIPENNNDSYRIDYTPQNMDYGYDKVDYGTPQVAGLLDTGGQGGLRAPSVLPADNSGQDSYDEWLQKYMASQEAQDGLLPMIQGKRTDTGGLI